ncbi:glycine/sarcosine/betaine reductase component B subunit [Clostridiaceae bacterium 35-E11]
MRLEVGRVRIKDLAFSSKTYIEKGVLYIDKEELCNYLKEDTNIAEVDIEFARPGESVRIIPIKDIVQPRYKVKGGGQVFPGFIGDVNTVGEGTTHVLEDCAVITCGKIVNFQEGIIDMSGPGAKYNSFSKMNNVVLLITPKDGLNKHTHEATVRIAGLKAAAYLGKAAEHLKPDETEVFTYNDIIEAATLYPALPKVAYVYMIQAQGLMHDNYIYGLNAKGILSTIISPTEVIDGAIVSGNCAAPCHKNATIHHLNNPVILELLRRHGKDLCFMGVIITNESTMLADKKRGAFYTQKIARIIGAEGAIITEEGGGNPETDLMLNCKNLEQAGIKTVLITDEYAGRDGRSQGLADVTAEADAVITNGNGNELITLPPMEKVIGYLESVEVITGGFSGSLHADGSITVEIASIMGSLCELGYERLTTRLK